MRSTPALRVEGLSVRYGDAVALAPVDLRVPAGGVTAVLGANGAGKSSLLQAVSGLVEHTGTVAVHGEPVERLPAERRARHVAHVPEGRHLFGELTTEQNLVLAAFGVSTRLRRSRLDRCYDVLPELVALRARPAGALSGGQQQMAAIARGLMAGAPVLCVDELSLGLAPAVAQRCVQVLGRLAGDDLTVVLVEQATALALSVATTAVVLRHGELVAQGSPADVRPLLHEAYLGAGGTPVHRTAQIVE